MKRARSELEATQTLLQEALQEKGAAVQEKAAGYALLRTEQGKGGRSVCARVFCVLCFVCVRLRSHGGGGRWYSWTSSGK